MKDTVKMGQTLTVNVKRASALSETDRMAWAALRASNPQCYSPYFHINYTETLSELRDDVYIACVYDADLPVAFLPYQGETFAKPVGAPMTDYHGFICKPEAQFDPVHLLKTAHIGAYHFSAVVNNQLTPHSQTTDEGVLMDVSQGAEGWRGERDGSYRRHLKSNRRRIRKAGEDIGEPRFVWASKDQAIFDQLIAWKKQKFAETGKYDVLSANWTMELLTRLWSSVEAELRCDMHALYFGDRLAAVDLGLTDGKTFHSWIVAYDGELHSYAPGIQLLEALIDESEALGYTRLDLGVGTDGYKRHYATEPVTTSNGFIAAKGTAAAFSNLYSKAESFGQKALKDAPGKLRRRYTQIAACENSVSGRAKAILSAVKSNARS
jgi:CelD/BcsL family acetyltransferase involved in cellulose biosynthesis